MAAKKRKTSSAPATDLHPIAQQGLDVLVMVLQVLHFSIGRFLRDALPQAKANRIPVRWPESRLQAILSRLPLRCPDRTRFVTACRKFALVSADPALDEAFGADENPRGVKIHQVRGRHYLHAFGNLCWSLAFAAEHGTDEGWPDDVHDELHPHKTEEWDAILRTGGRRAMRASHADDGNKREDERGSQERTSADKPSRPPGVLPDEVTGPELRHAFAIPPTTWQRWQSGLHSRVCDGVKVFKVAEVEKIVRKKRGLDEPWPPWLRARFRSRARRA